MEFNMKQARIILTGLCLVGLAACFEQENFQKLNIPDNASTRDDFARTAEDIRRSGYSCASVQIAESCEYRNGRIIRYSCGPVNDPAKIYKDEIYTMFVDDRAETDANGRLLSTFHQVDPNNLPRDTYTRWKGKDDKCPPDPFVTKAAPGKHP
jgi:hypothetical protein